MQLCGRKSYLTRQGLFLHKNVRDCIKGAKEHQPITCFFKADFRGVALWAQLEGSHVSSMDQNNVWAIEERTPGSPHPTNTQRDTKYGATAFILISFQIICFALSASGLSV